MKSIAIVLSGGGIRAMVFHLGMLKFLAEKNALERITRISTVSGGSLIVGLILSESDLTWPSSTEFKLDVYESIKKKLCSQSLMWSAIRQLVYPHNWRFLLSRANLVAIAIQKQWGITAKLSDLQAVPEWSINGTTAENGKRFRFKRENIGDYSIGYAQPEDFPLASAMAVSAAFPGAIGPLVLDTTVFKWLLREWGADKDKAKQVNPIFRRIHIYDGGVYDNLGLEPYFDAGTGKPKLNIEEAILLSDAGAPLKEGLSAGILSPWRLFRVADIMSNQSRSLRVRSFVNYLKSVPGSGGYVYIATPLEDEASTADAKLAVSFPTSLKRLDEAEFDAIAAHGYRVAKQVHEEFGAFV